LAMLGEAVDATRAKRGHHLEAVDDAALLAEAEDADCKSGKRPTEPWRA